MMQKRKDGNENEYRKIFSFFNLYREPLGHLAVSACAEPACHAVSVQQ